MVAAAQRVAKAFAAAVRKIVEPKIARFAKPETKLDDDDDDEDLDDLEDRMTSAALSSFDELHFRAVSDTAASRVQLHSKHEFKRLGIDLVKSEPKFGPLIARWRKENVDRISGMQKDQVGKIRRILEDGQNHRVETLAAEIERQLDDVTASRAETIARSQVLKLNGQITQERQTACGIEQFVWTTSNDERVREEHEALEGQVFSWEDGGDEEEGIPGEAPNCRCVAFPILPELDEADADAAAE